VKTTEGWVTSFVNLTPVARLKVMSHPLGAEVHVYSEYEFDQAWNTDHDAGITLSKKSVPDLILALHRALEKRSTEKR